MLSSFAYGRAQVHSRKFELEVLDFFASIWQIPRDQFWGYVVAPNTILEIPSAS